VRTVWRDEGGLRGPIRREYRLSSPTLPHTPHTRQVNYISHFLLTQLLLPTLLSTVSASAPGTVRIIDVSSDGHAKLAPKQGIVFDDINLKSASTWTRYGQSKLANVLHAKELARRYGTQGLWAASLHPGTVKTFVAPSP
jgi:NAD(P)-dependent dehydrogenase (short-subunit alcohol dehydrogenase family)